MKLYATNLAEMILRFYAMMAIILIAGFTKQWWLGIVGFVLFFATLVGAKLKDENTETGEGKVVNMPGNNPTRKAM